MVSNGGLIVLEQGGVNPEITLSLDPEPFVKPTKDSKRILVVGGGVSGLMTAWILLDQGYYVTEYPPGGCGLTEIAAPGKGWATIEHYREWALESYEFYEKLDQKLDGKTKVEFGLTIAKLNQFFYHTLDEVNELNEDDVLKLEAIKKEAQNGRMKNLEIQNPETLAKIFAKLDIGQQWREQLKAGYTHDAPVINTDRGIVFLMSMVRRKGADFETREIKEKYRICVTELAADYDEAAVINASGLGSNFLADDDDVYPVRGAVKRVENVDSDSFEHLTQAYLVPAQKGDAGQPTKVVFCVPRSEDTYIVGSIIQPNNHDLSLAENSPEVEIMWKRARTFLPALNDSHTIPYYPLAQGLRPFCKKNAKVRSERIGKMVLVHYPGHGGSGWTLSVRCARSAVFLLDLVLNQGKSPEEAYAKLYPVN